MDALKCDRCNGYFDYDPNKNNSIAFGHKHIVVSKALPIKDICPNCMELFMKWFENSESKCEKKDKEANTNEKK